ncbi:MAG: queuosine precursor transporter [Dehalococcoidia bacterium]
MSSADPTQFDVRTRLYVWLAAFFVTCLVMANVLGVKLFEFSLSLGPLGSIPVRHTIGMLPFPITFLLTDLLNEYYGKRATRRVAYIALAMAALAAVLTWLARQFPILEGVPGTATRDSFENIFGASALMQIASIIAFFVGSMLDIWVFGLFKRLTGGRFVWLRATGSTVISQLFDSLVITYTFFVTLQVLTGGQPATIGFVLETAATGYILKFVIAVLLTPLIYLGRWFIRVRFGLTPAPV